MHMNTPLLSPHPFPYTGNVELPGDKSISHRSVLFTILRPGVYHLSNIAPNADVAASARALEALGATIEKTSPTEWVITSPEHINQPTQPIDCANSGTTIRLLTGLLSGLQVSATLVGDESLSSRPMGRVISPLSQMGASIQATQTDSGKLTAPLTLWPSDTLSGYNHTLAVASAQVKSALLLAGLLAHGTTTVTEPVPTRDHTERLLRHMGIPIQSSSLADGGFQHQVQGPYARIATAKQHHWRIPSDISSAAFFMVGALITPGSSIAFPTLGTNPGRTGILDALTQWGVSTTQTHRDNWQGEPIATISIEHQPLTGQCVLEGNLIPALIDEIPILAIAALFSSGGLVVRDAEELRHKESDRISVLADALMQLGYTITETPDGFTLPGPQVWNGTLPTTPLATHGDHRMAMALRILNHAVCPTQRWPLDAPDCVTVSFPDFEPVLARITGQYQ